MKYFKQIKINGRWLVLWLMISLLSVNTHGQNTFCDLDNTVIHDGEKLTYKAYYNLAFAWVNAGEATFTTTLTQLYGNPVYHIVGEGATYSSYDWIFKVRDKYETWIDTENLLPVRFKRHVREGGYAYDNLVTFNQTKHYANSKDAEFKTSTCIQDVLSAIFYARNIDYDKYKPGDKIHFNMFLDNEIYSIYIRYLGKGTVKTRYGKFHAIKIAPLLIKGTLFKGGEDMVVWVSDDKNHVPVRVESPIIVGSVKADLMGFKNLKYPLTSLIKRR